MSPAVWIVLLWLGFAGGPVVIGAVFTVVLRVFHGTLFGS
jgi:hypothetical protein